MMINNFKLSGGFIVIVTNREFRYDDFEYKYAITEIIKNNEGKLAGYKTTISCKGKPSYQAILNEDELKYLQLYPHHLYRITERLSKGMSLIHFKVHRIENDLFDRLVDKIGMSIWNKNKEVTIEDIRFINISDFTSNWKDIGCALSNENITIAYHNSFKELTSDFNKNMYMLKWEDLDTIDEDYLVYVDYNKLGHINYHSDPEKFINAVREQNKEMFDNAYKPFREQLEKIYDQLIDEIDRYGVDKLKEYILNQ